MEESANRDFLDPKALARLAALPLNARFPMQGSVSGRHRSTHRGSSLEFAEYRKYVPGDDTRRLDWRAYARSDRFYIKEFEADTNLRMCLVMDSSGSMNFGSGDVSKIDYARRLAGSLAYLAANQGDAVGLYRAGEHIDVEIPPRRNAAHLRTVLDSIGETTADGSTGLADILHAVAECTPQRALVIILSDLFLEPSRLRHCFQHLRFRKHDVVVFHLLDPAELAFDFNRPMRFLDMEGGAPVLVEPSVIAAEYRQALSEYLEDLRTIVRDTAVDYHRIQIHENYDDVLSRFLLGRISGR